PFFSTHISIHFQPRAVNRSSTLMLTIIQISRHFQRLLCILISACCLFAAAQLRAQNPSPIAPAANPAAEAATAGDMKPYTETINNPDASSAMPPTPGGNFTMGSPDTKPGRKPDEGPQHEVQLDPFWLGKCEVTWNEFEIFMFTPDIDRRK